MSEIQDILQKITTEATADLAATKKFFASAYQYAVDNIKPEVVKAVGDAMTAAEAAFTAGTSVDKFDFAFSNAVAVLTADGVAFVEADINFAVEAFIQVRNAALTPIAPKAA